MAALVASLTIAGCGADAGRDPSTPAPSKEVQRAAKEIAAIATRKPGPHDGSYRVPYASVVDQTDDLDLLNAVTDPMIDPLSEATPAQARRRLNADQYRVWALFTIDVDVSDGGIAEIYFNSSGDYATGAVRQLASVGAPRHAGVLRAANRALWPDGRVPQGADRRRRAMLDDPRLDAAERSWAAADQAEGDLDAVLARYIRTHLPSFVTP